MKYGKLIKPDGTLSYIAPENRTDYQLPELYKLLNCDMVELVYLANGQYMLVDEEGWLKDNPRVNVVATKLYWAGRQVEHLIAGNVLVCDSDMFR